MCYGVMDTAAVVWGLPLARAALGHWEPLVWLGHCFLPGTRFLGPAPPPLLLPAQPDWALGSKGIRKSFRRSESLDTAGGPPPRTLLLSSPAEPANTFPAPAGSTPGCLSAHTPGKRHPPGGDQDGRWVRKQWRGARGRSLQGRCTRPLVAA